MALITNINAISDKYFLKKIADQLATSHPLLNKMLGKAKKVSGGTSIQVPVSYQRTSARGHYDGDQTFSLVRTDPFTAATFSWKHNWIAAILQKTDMLVNAGEGEIVNLMAASLEVMKNDFKDLLATDLNSAGGWLTDTQAPYGIAACLDDGTNYEFSSDITPRATYTWWKGNYYNLASELISLEEINYMQQQCQSNNTKITLMTTTDKIFAYLWKLFLPKRIIQDMNMLALNDSFDNIVINGRTLVRDSYCQTGVMNFLNLDEDHCRLFILSGENFDTTKWIDKEPDQRILVKQCFLGWQLIGDNPRYSGRIIGITEPTFAEI